MPRLPIVVAVCALLTGLTAAGALVARSDASGAVAHQAASPEAEEVQAPPVASPGIERVGCGAIGIGDAGLTLEFNEVRFAPGEAIQEKHYWQPVIAYVASGEVELNVIRVPADGVALLRTLDTQESDHQPWECAVSEELHDGASVTLTAGDALFLENVRYQISNPFSRDAVLLTAVLDARDDDACLGGCPRWP